MVRLTATRIAIPQIVGLLIIVGTAAAAVNVTYSASSTLTLGAKAAPVTFAAGADSTPSDYVTSFSLSDNRTRFVAGVSGVPDATVVIDDLVQVKNEGSRDHAVALLASTVADPLVRAYKIEIVSSGAVVGVLDLKTAAPEATFTLPKGQTYQGRVTIELAPGAVPGELASAVAISMVVRG